MAIALTYLQRWPTVPRNAMSLIDRCGSIMLTYAKVHTCDFDKEAALTPGDAGIYRYAMRQLRVYLPLIFKGYKP